MLYLWLGSERPTRHSFDSGMVSRYYFGWPLHLHRGNSAFKNLQHETQWLKCCLYETLYAPAPIRETGDVIARTPPNVRLPTDAPTRARFFFCSQVMRFLRDPSCWNNGSYVPFLQGSHMQKQYHQRITLRTWEPWRMQERDSEWSALTIAHHIHGASVPLGTTVAWRYDVPRDWLWDACHMAGVRRGSRCKRFCSKEGPHYCLEQSARKLT